MGRPLSKKYFGNLNPSGVGGDGVASAAVSGGSYTTRPVFTFTAPEDPSGVTATATITSEVNTATVGGTQTKAYQVGQTMSIGNGAATFTVATLSAASPALTTVTVTSTAGAIAFDTITAMPIGTSVHVTGTDTAGSGLVPTTTYYVKASSATTATLVSTYAAAITGTGGAIVTVVGNTTGLTLTPRGGAANAAGPVATVTPASRGSYEALTTGAQATSTTDGGVGATLTVAYRAKSTIITNPGAGYAAAPTAATGPTQSVVLGTVTLTTGIQNAIIARGIPALGGSGTDVADIEKQVSARRYRITSSSGTGICTLVTDGAADAVGEMTISAYDSSGAAYWVSKLTAHLATIVRQNPALGNFASNTAVQWTFNDINGTKADETMPYLTAYNVKIESK
jgi:hypothetical protein